MLRKFTILREIVIILKIPYDATIAFQNQKLTLSDVYSQWVIMQLHLNACDAKPAYKTKFAKKLHNALEKRKDVIFKNPLMNCALFLDPRFNLIIVRNETKMCEVKENLLQIWRRLIILQNTNTNANANESELDKLSSSQSSDDLIFHFDTNAAMNAYLGIVESQGKDNNNDIDYIIEQFQPNKLDIEASVLEFWESVKDEQNELYKIAMVVFSVPPTEVQVERDFSHLAHVFGDKRCRLTEERLEDILFLHLNKDLFYEVNSDEQKLLLSSLNRSMMSNDAISLHSDSTDSNSCF